MWRENELVLSYVLGTAFTLMLLGFDMKNFIEEGLIHSIAEQFPGRMDPHAGYIGLGINYAFFTVATLFSPAIVGYLGSRLSLFFCSIVLVGYMVGFMVLNTWIYYAISAFMGVACGVMWTAQGVYMSQYTTRENVLRNSGIFWAITCVSFLIGGIMLFVLFSFTDNSIFTESVVRCIFGLFVITGSLGSLGFLVLPTQRKPYSKEFSIISCINKNFEIMGDRRMQLVTITFLYLGVQTSYFLGIYPTCMLFTEQLRSSVGNQIIGCYGVVIGVGEILVGFVITFYCQKTNGGRLFPIVIAGLITHMLAYGLTYLSFHKNSKFEVISDPAHVPTSLWLSMIIAFLLAAGDNCWNTVRGAYLTHTFTQHKGQVFAMSKFFQSIASCVTYLVGKYIDLHGQLLLNTVLAILASASLYLLIKDEEGEQKKAAKLARSANPKVLAMNGASRRLLTWMPLIGKNLTETRGNAYRASIGKISRAQYLKRYQATIMRPDGSTVVARFAEPRHLVQLPVDLQSLSEDERRQRLAARKPKSRKIVEEVIDDNFDLDEYSTLWDKKA